MSDRTYFVLGKQGHPSQWSVLDLFTGKGARKTANEYANARQRMYGEDSAIVVGELDDDAPARQAPTPRARSQPKAEANTPAANTASSNTATANTASANTATANTAQ